MKLPWIHPRYFWCLVVVLVIMVLIMSLAMVLILVQVLSLMIIFVLTVIFFVGPSSSSVMVLLLRLFANTYPIYLLEQRIVKNLDTFPENQLTSGEAIPSLCIGYCSCGISLSSVASFFCFWYSGACLLSSRTSSDLSLLLIFWCLLDLCLLIILCCLDPWWGAWCLANLPWCASGVEWQYGGAKFTFFIFLGNTRWELQWLGKEDVVFLILSLIAKKCSSIISQNMIQMIKIGDTIRKRTILNQMW